MHHNFLRCPACGSGDVIRSGQTTRVFKTLPVGSRKVELSVDIPRLECKCCGAIQQPRLEFAKPKKHYTKSLERFVVELCGIATIQDVSLLTGLSWDTVKEIHKRHLREKYKTVPLKKVRHHKHTWAAT